MIVANHRPASIEDAVTHAISRRTWLQGLGAGTLGLRLAGSSLGSGSSHGAADRSLILLTMVGGPSPWETFDPKPDAPASLRGPFDSIATAVPGVRLTAQLPAIARRLDQMTLVRSLYHDANPTHDAGLRLLLTGQTTDNALPLGSIAARDLGARRGMPPFVVLPNLVGPVERSTRPGFSNQEVARGLAPFVTGSPRFDPDHLEERLRVGSDRAATRRCWNWDAERPATRARFGDSDFGRNCWLAARLVAAGTRVVVVNMATRLVGQPTWDGHGRSPFGIFDDYAQHLLPTFDQSCAALVDHLRERGQLDSTLVIATGEMGRTPWINESGGRDHWPGVWSGLLAGGGTQGGAVIGSSAADGSEPRDAPVHVADLVAAAGSWLGLNLPGRAGSARLAELFG